MHKNKQLKCFVISLYICKFGSVVCFVIKKKTFLDVLNQLKTETELHNGVQSEWYLVLCDKPVMDFHIMLRDNYCLYVLTQNLTRKNALWGPFSYSSFRPPFFSENLS